MAPIPENNTFRYWVKYRSNGREHEMMFRWGEEYVEDGSDITTQVARIAAFLADLAPLLPTDFDVLSARFSRKGWTYSLPTTPPAGPTTTAPTFVAEAPAFLTFVGRTFGGRRWKLHVLGVSYSPADGVSPASDYRIAPGENAAITTCITNLDGWPALVGIDEQAVNLYGYANAGYNAHWQRKMRT